MVLFFHQDKVILWSFMKREEAEVKTEKKLLFFSWTLPSAEIKKKICYSSHIKQLCAQVYSTVTWWIIALQSPLSMELSRQEYWSGLPFPSPRNLLDPGIKPTSLTSAALAGRFFTINTTWEAHKIGYLLI